MTDNSGVLQSSPGLNAASSPSGSISTEDTSSIQNSGNGGTPQPPSSAKSDAPQPTSSFPVKTDKPRPHVCTTCSRSFARLEHLKRHERSHTKEKPFECPECTRCFARRDLLLRHQQKLHMTTTPSSRPRGSRRESTSSISGNTNRVRKNSTSSVGSGVGGGPRPRANTISHIDGATLDMLGAANRSVGSLPSVEAPFSAAGPGSFHPRGMSASGRIHGNVPTLPRLATQGHNMHMGGELRTAPVGNAMGHYGFDPNFQSYDSTINPAQLHMNDSMGMLHSPGINQSPFTPQPVIMEDDDGMEWMHGFNTQMSFGGLNNHGMPENAVQDSPQPMHGSGPMGGFGEMQFDPSTTNPNMLWSPQGHMSGGPSMSMPLESSNPATSNFEALTQTISPGTLHSQALPETIYENSTLNLNTNGNVSSFPGHFHSNRAISSDGTDGSSATGSAGRQSSVTSTSIDSITDTTRNALLISLSQPPPFGQRKFSHPNTNPSLSTPGPNLPPTSDLQRYISAYIQYFHPHMPFIHVPTLSFDQPAFNSNIQSNNGAPTSLPHGGITGGGGCLVLAMAAIGALYEFERQASKELFEAAKRMIQLYLEERRKAETNPSSKQNMDPASQNTPLWLVQAMLLNIVSGHQSDDKIAGDIASTHCTALVSLAKSAGLTQPLSETEAMSSTANSDVQMSDAPAFHDLFGNNNRQMDEASQWYRWIKLEERKRTLFAIFHMSSLLVVAYNHAPALMNSEIHLDLPCDEVLWKADTPHMWMARKRELGDSTGSLSFPTALGELLMASQNPSEFRPLSHGQPFGSGIPREEVPKSDLKPSTYGCLVLIDALHNYIWETRQRHCGREWTTQETESMHAHIEPALRAWQAAWNTNAEHSLERPNPHGHGPLSADSIPLLDLAYVRLFVNLGTSKDALWQRDYQTMSDEIARGSDFIQHADNSSESSTNGANTAIHSPTTPQVSGTPEVKMDPGHSGESADTISEAPQESFSGKRERHLRRAASYAADSLIYADKLGVTFGDFSARELPVQSALCAFDCAQVLAEWVATVQERVGQYIGIIGRDPIDFSSVPAIMLLDEEDGKLIGKCEEILRRVEHKMSNELGNATHGDPIATQQVMSKLPSSTVEGYGSKILRSTSFILGRALVWPVTSLLSNGLEYQADHMWKRAESSIGVQS